MMNGKKLALIALAVLVAALVASPTARQAIGLGYEADRLALEEQIRAQLKDPESAKFREERIYPGPAGGPSTLCGEINARNSMGGYVGFRRFIAYGTAFAIIEDEEGEITFHRAWKAMCVSLS